MKNRVCDFALFMLFILIFCFACVSTAPIVQSFNKFFTHVVANKCDLPRNIKPFAPSARGWYFLSEPLSQCNDVNTTFETNTLCAEIFESFINTTCSTTYSKSIPKISYPLSSDVCTDFAESVNIVPKIEGYVGGKLADRTVCQLACASKYEILCKVLLWSYQIRNHIVTALNADTENQNDPKHPAQSQVDLKPAAENHNDLKSPNKAQDEIDAQQQESIGNPNGVSSAPINAGVENENGMLHDPKLTDEIAKKAFDDHRRLIPDFGAHDEENQGQTMSPEMKVEVVSSTEKDLRISGAVDYNKKTDTGVKVVKTNEILNEHENGKAIELSSPRNDDMNQNIEVTVTKNQNTTSNADSTTAKKIAKEKLKLKIKEKLKKPEANQNIVVNQNNATNLNPEINVGENTIPVETNENLSNNEDNQLETKNIPSPGNDRIDHMKNDLGNELDHETLKEDKAGEKVEDTNLNTEKLVSSSSSTTQDPLKDNQLHSVSDVSVTSNAKVSKPSEQLNSPSIPDNKDSTSKTGIKSTVENQGKSISLTGISSDASNLESTTLEVAMEGMDDANEIPPPVQDQFNDLENGDTEGEYDRPDYAPDGALPPSTENRKVIAQDFFSTSEKTSVFNDQQNDFSKLYDDFIPKNIGGQVPEDIRRIPPFPEEEDGHFFFYFLTIILILMIGYLLFHNKQKIIALIVEGRHERRRRSYGAGYKKLETK